jgi:hypothetical protein
MDTLRRLWQPSRPLFWLMLVFNGLSSLCTWALRTWPLHTPGTLLVGMLALGNVVFGLLAAWKLVREEPPPRRTPPGHASEPPGRPRDRRSAAFERHLNFVACAPSGTWPLGRGNPCMTASGSIVLDNYDCQIEITSAEDSRRARSSTRVRVSHEVEHPFKEDPCRI